MLTRFAGAMSRAGRLDDGDVMYDVLYDGDGSERSERYPVHYNSIYTCATWQNR